MIHVIGDSHSKMIFGQDPRFTVHHLGPVPMYRIAKDGKRTVDLQALGVVSGDTVIWCFGEIDVRCRIIKQRDLLAEDVLTIIDNLVKEYMFSLVQIQREMPALRNIILAVIPPTDHTHDPDFPKYGTIAERVYASNKLNDYLEEACEDEEYMGVLFRYVYPFGTFEDQGGALKHYMSDGNVHVGPDYAHLVIERVIHEL